MKGPQRRWRDKEPLLWAQSECPGVLWADDAWELSWGPEAQGPQSLAAVSGVGASLQGLCGWGRPHGGQCLPHPTWLPSCLATRLVSRLHRASSSGLGLVAFLTPRVETGAWPLPHSSGTDWTLAPRVGSCSTWGLRPHPSTPSTEDMGPGWILSLGRSADTQRPGGSPPQQCPHHT